MGKGKVITIDLYDIFYDHNLCALVVSHPTGVKYSNQSGGIGCQHPDFEGFVLSTFDYAEGLDECELGCSDIDPYYPLTQDAAAQAISNEIDDKFKEKDRYGFIVKFDWSRKRELLEDWWPVVVSGDVTDGVKLDNHPCIYTRMQNCD